MPRKRGKNRLLAVLAIKPIIPAITNRAGFEELLHPVLLESNIKRYEQDTGKKYPLNTRIRQF